MIDVTCAVIRNEDNEILIVQRGEKSDHPYKWEFPGGKISAGESAEDCIIREIDEELSLEIVICHRLKDVEYDYGKKQIRLIPYVCDTLDDLPFLAEHIAYKWVNAEKLLSFDYSEADVFVAEDYLRHINPGKAGGNSNIDLPSSEISDDEIQQMVVRMVSMKEAGWIAVSAVDNPAMLNKLLEFSFSKDKKLAFRSSWVLTKAGDRAPGIFNPFLPRIIESLSTLENESAVRSFLRILSFTDPVVLDKKHQGLLADYCFKQLNSGFSAIAIKAYSMEILYRLTIIYPELATELALSVKSVMEIDSAGIRSKAKSILNKLSK